MNENILVPPPVTAACQARGRFGFGFGRRFFFLFVCGLLWIIPGFWNRTFLYAVAAWDCLLLVAKAVAAIDARDYLIPDDVKTAALPVLRHRMILKPEAELEGMDTDRVITEVLAAVEVPK